jgi:acetoacetyl-CoA reductase
MTAAMKPEVLDAMVKLIPLGRIGQPDDIANGVAFLASETAAWITGETLSINGGQFMY